MTYHPHVSELQTLACVAEDGRSGVLLSVFPKDNPVSSTSIEYEVYDMIFLLENEDTPIPHDNLDLRLRRVFEKHSEAIEWIETMLPADYDVVKWHEIDGDFNRVDTE